ncbi:hypothetical protein BDZ89DRAFT_164173 [Hymenopellis radicata]|nr:hypothetical protein BDZ89DRAFT_164173 [Hymenopellis radicata]
MIDHNAYNVLLPQDYHDYLLHIETETGRKRTYKRFLKRVQDAATVLTSSTKEGGADIRHDNDELVGIISHNTMDYSVLAYALLSQTVPFAPIPFDFSRVDLIHAFKTLPLTRLFVHSDYLKTVTSIFSELIDSDGWSAPHIYILGGYSIEWWPEFWRMVQYVRKTEMRPVNIKHAKHDSPAYLTFSSLSLKVLKTTHGDLINTLPRVSSSSSSPTSRPTRTRIPVTLSVSPIPDLFRMFLTPTTFVILPKWTLHFAITAIPQNQVTHLWVDERIALDLLKLPQLLAKAALQSIKVLTGESASVNAVKRLCGTDTKIVNATDDCEPDVGGGLWMMAPAGEMSLSKL